MVLRAARGILRDDHEAMDAFQATFLILVRKGPSLWVRDSLGPWLHRVACRSACRARTEAGRRRALKRGLVELVARRAARDDQDDLAAAVHEELDRLPDRYRMPIVLCDLEGHTCQEAARHLGCPIGTIGSRLARGRQQLRGRLARRGLGPTASALMSVLSPESPGATVPPALVTFTTQLGLAGASGQLGAATCSPASAKLAKDVMRSLLVMKRLSFGAVSLAAVGLCLLANRTTQPGTTTPAPDAVVQVAPKRDPVRGLTDEFPFMNDKDRTKDFLYAEIGNMRPLVENEHGVRFRSRQAILYKDGTAKLWRPEQKEPVAPAFRHRGPIRELTFFDEANLLITRSDKSIKIWDALTGAPRKELDGQSIQPMWLSFAPRANRFVTIDYQNKTVTVWDAAKLNAVGTIHATGIDRAVAAGLSGDGKTVVMFRSSPEPSAELWDVMSGRSFATLRLPSSTVAEVFTEGGTRLHRNSLQTSVGERDTRFWDVVQSLAPTAGDPKGSPDKP
jgi:RNA polymerase sigma factor (sigma-70 family)